MINNPKVGDRVWYAATLQPGVVWEAIVSYIPHAPNYEVGIDVQMPEIGLVTRPMRMIFLNKADAMNMRRL